RACRGPAGQELVRGGGRRRQGPAEPPDRAAQPGRGLRRVTRDALVTPRRRIPRTRDRPLNGRGTSNEGWCFSLGRLEREVRGGGAPKRLRRPSVSRTAGGRPAPLQIA